MTGKTLLLIHGLGATAGVWADVSNQIEWPGRVAAVELPGHGNAPWTGDYTLGALAAAVSARCERDEPTVVLGHSLGGGVGLCLATGFFRPRVEAVIGLGIKVNWTDADVAGMAKVADRGVRWFDSEAEAVERYLRQAGLDGLIGPGHPAVSEAVVEDGGRWRVAQDPATFAQNALDTSALMAAARCRIVLGAGEHDAMSTREDLVAYVDEPRIAPGCGHNVHVEDPRWVADLLSQLEP